MAGNIKILESTDSPINGPVVVEELGSSRKLTVNGIVQSGNVVEKVWKEPLQHIKSLLPDAGNCLILGLGAGSIVKGVKDNWSRIKITGVEVDPVIVGLGQKYFGLNDLNIKIVIDDALIFTINEINNKHKYDLILFDVFIGNRIPVVYGKEAYIKLIKKILNKDGVIAFNRIIAGDYADDTKEFHEILKKHFKKIVPVFGSANVVFACSNS